MSGFIHPDPIPESYLHNQFCFHILHPQYVELDYAALMSSKDFLRRWSQSEWPADDFSLEENLTDLAWHYEEQLNKFAFTYTILDSNRSTCLGCVYLKPIDTIKELQLFEQTLLADFSHFCSFWVIDKIRGTQLDELIFSGLINWLNVDWQFPGMFFTSNPHIPEMEDLYQEHGMQRFLELERPNRYQYCWQ